MFSVSNRVKLLEDFELVMDTIEIFQVQIIILKGK